MTVTIRSKLECWNMEKDMRRLYFLRGESDYFYRQSSWQLPKEMLFADSRDKS